MPVICCEMSTVALWVCCDRVLTSAATTANPLPASPARAASMVALRASRFVWEAISEMMPIMLPMRSDASRSVSTLAITCRDC